jgi:hypothetical protein
MPYRSFLCVLLITLALPAYSSASMLDPDSDNTGIDTSAPSSPTSLKEKLEAARIAAGTPPIAGTQSIAAQPPVPVVTPVTQSEEQIAPIAAPYVPKFAETTPVAKPPVALPPKKIAAAQPIDQQVIRFDSGSIAATPPPPQTMDELLFDNGNIKASASSSKGLLSGNLEPMPAAPITHVDNEMIPAPVPAKTASPKIAETISSPLPQAMPAPVPMMAPMAHDELTPVAQTPQVQTVVTHEPHIEKTVTVLPPVIPPEEQASKKPFESYIPAIEVRKAPDAVPASRFKPMPAQPLKEWTIRNMEPSAPGKNDAVCLLQNRFSNNLILVIGQNNAGEGLVAIDYGIDMFSMDQDYHVKVELDENYSKEFSAYTTSPQKLMIPIGKNPEFFAALQSADALHVELKGAASTFAVNNLSQGLQNFSKCVADMGGAALPAAMAKQAPKAMAQTEMPAIPNPVVTQENIIPNNKPAYVAAVAPPVLTPSPQQPLNSLANDTWDDATLITLKQAGFVPYGLQKSSDQMQWINKDGTLHISARKISVANILDASSLLLDSQEKTCGGKFASQMGVPEIHGKNNILMMESKCSTANVTMVSTWLITNQGNDFTAWQMETTRDERGIAFDARQQLLNTLTKQ